LRFFWAAQIALVDRLAEMILPADDQSPGAHGSRRFLHRSIDQAGGLANLDSRDRFAIHHGRLERMDGTAEVPCVSARMSRA
jgi:hypothetical protein